jgi:hypothetical protein
VVNSTDLGVWGGGGVVEESFHVFFVVPSLHVLHLSLCPAARVFSLSFPVVFVDRCNISIVAACL